MQEHQILLVVESFAELVEVIKVLYVIDPLCLNEGSSCTCHESVNNLDFAIKPRFLVKEGKMGRIRTRYLVAQLLCTVVVIRSLYYIDLLQSRRKHQ